MTVDLNYGLSESTSPVVPTSAEPDRRTPLRTWKMNDDLDTSTGRVVMVDGVEAVAQILERRLRTIRGEYFLGRRSAGVPYYEDVLVYAPIALIMEQAFAETILSSPGVDGLNRLDLDVPASDPRKLVVTFEARSGSAVISRTVPLEL